MNHLPKISQESVETAVSIILRVPALFLIEIWWRTNPHTVISQLHSDDVEIIVTVAYYMILILAVAVATLPLRHLVIFYIYLVCAGLMGVAGLISQAYVAGEKLEHEAEVYASIGQNGAEKIHDAGLTALLNNRRQIERLFFHILAQVFIAALVAYLMEIKNWVKFTLLAFALPVVARLVGFPVSELHLVHNFATVYTILLILFCIFNHLGSIIDICKEGIYVAGVTVQTFGIIPVALTFWRTMALPAQLLLFWGLMFLLQIYVYVYGEHIGLLHEGWLVILLASMGECCATPVSLLALCVAITYTSCAILNLTKLYLQGLDGFDNDTMRGWTEGFTMLLIAVQTDLLDLKPLQRAFLMSILLFIVGTSLIQSMYEIADPVLLALSASHNRSIMKHVKAVSLCIMLCILPLYMTYFICQYFEMDFWLMVIVSSCLLTSVQVIGSLVVYTLFMYDFMRAEPWENLDDIIYFARAVTRVMEFIVAVFVVCFGLKESVVGEWSWINSIILVVHCYFNVWQRLQSGWKSFLLRWEAAKKVESLPQASADVLAQHDDVCAICYSEMHTACITPCAHLFHSICLRKWLYVKETCPMCHRDLAVSSDTQTPEEGDEHPHDIHPDGAVGADGDGDEVNNSSSSSDPDLDYDEAELAEADQ
ncbi:RING finger protein 145-like [Plakobranchus ocellatus]|uniref:RING finger protein 145-like n=1 Tax=Plakobranchus ocellatus TaxID=259542 RepID=A0AAV3YP58_9GAST|nr:RING finger protein 145-like [Plakobranchus ocellatus]